MHARLFFCVPLKDAHPSGTASSSVGVAVIVDVVVVEVVDTTVDTFYVKGDGVGDNKFSR